MKLTECKTGREYALRCRVEGPVPTELLDVGEHSLVRSAHDGGFSIEHASGRLQIDPIGREDRLAATDLADPQAAVLLQLEREKADRWLILARRFAHRLRLDAPLELVMPTELEEKLGARARARLSTWAQSQLVLGDWCFAWCGGQVFDSDAFELLGRNKRLRVARREDRLVVTGVGRALTRGGGILIEGRLSLSTERDLVVEAVADELVEKALAGSGFMDLWAQYQQAERRVLEEEAARLGAIQYSRWRETQDGLCFTLPRNAPQAWRETELQISLQARHPASDQAVQVSGSGRSGSRPTISKPSPPRRGRSRWICAGISPA